MIYVIMKRKLRIYAFNAGSIIEHFTVCMGVVMDIPYLKLVELRLINYILLITLT